MGLGSLGLYVLCLGLFALSVGFVDGKGIGQSCSFDSTCTGSYSINKVKECKDKICQCKPGIEIKYSNHNLNPTCDSLEQSLSVLYDSCTETGCPANEECLQVQFAESIYYRMRKEICYCKEGYIRVGDNCYFASHQKVLEKCGNINNGTVHSCNLNENSICSNRKCICTAHHFANLTSGKCEPKIKYIKAHNLTSYRVKPNEYCMSSSDCLSGLTCSSFKCACPYPCKYNATIEGCDCGLVSYNAPVAPIILGVLLGIIIMGCWAYKIKMTIHKLKKKHNSRFSHLDDAVEQTSPTRNTGNSYALNPVSSSNGTTGDTGISSPGLGTHPSPKLGYSPLPTKSGNLDASNGDLAGPPQASDYGINPPSNPSYLLPPIYSAPPSTDDNTPSAPLGFSSNDSSTPSALPYSANPSDSTSGLPYPVNPSNTTSGLPYPASPNATSGGLPYPTNPNDSSSELPYPSSPSSVPYPSSPSASYSLNPTTPAAAPTAYDPTVSTPSAYNPTGSTPSAYDPTGSTPSAYDPTGSTPSAYDPTGSTQSAYDPTGSTPSAYDPMKSTPSAFDPTGSTPSAYDPMKSTPSAYDPTGNTPSAPPPAYNPTGSTPSYSPPAYNPSYP